MKTKSPNKKTVVRKAAPNKSKHERSPAAIAAAKSKRAAMARIAAARAEVAKARAAVQAPEPRANNIFGVSKQVPGYTPTPPSKPRPKGAPPPVIAKPKPKPKPVEQAASNKPPKKKIDFGTAVTVSSAAVRAAAAVKPGSAAAASGGYVVISGRRVRVMSTKGIKVKRKPRKPAAASVVPTVVAAVKFARTKLGKRELDQYERELISRRNDLVGRVRGVEDEALRSSGGNLSTMPLHMADIGSDTFDQDFALGMAEGDRNLLLEIEAAITRIKDKSYGVCMMTGKQIPKARLNATPWAKYTVEAARQSERNQARA